MADTASLARSGFRYVYLAVFFALLAGFFHPFLTGSSFGIVIIGVLVLFAGLAGAVLLYRAAATESKPGRFENIQSDIISYRPPRPDARRWVFLAGGIILIVISLFYIYQLTGRI